MIGNANETGGGACDLVFECACVQLCRGPITINFAEKSAPDAASMEHGNEAEVEELVLHVPCPSWAGGWECWCTTLVAYRDVLLHVQ